MDDTAKQPSDSVPRLTIFDRIFTNHHEPQRVQRLCHRQRKKMIWRTCSRKERCPQSMLFSLSQPRAHPCSLHAVLQTASAEARECQTPRTRAERPGTE